MKTLCVFNPEHDLALANGGKYFVPPESALEFAKTGGAAMKHIFGEDNDDVAVVPAVMAGMEYSRLAAHGDEVRLMPWGWNVMLKTQLLKQGVPECLMPSDGYLSRLRTLQHRSSFVSLNSDARFVSSFEQLEAILQPGVSYMFKAPWSGSGRGLRRVDGVLTEKDKEWCSRMIRYQDGFVVEPFYDVVVNFAVEYFMQDNTLTELGYSLFSASNGVYRYNLLLHDVEIASYIAKHVSSKALGDEKGKVEAWLSEHAAFYNGPVGVDMLVYRFGDTYALNPCVEINFRCTMGLAAHHYLRYNDSHHGEKYFPIMPKH